MAVTRPLITTAFGVHTNLDHLVSADEHSRRSGSLVLVRDRALGRKHYPLITASAARMVIDPWQWDRLATPTESLAIGHPGLSSAMSWDAWGASVISRSGAAAVLTPSRFVRLGDWVGLSRLATELLTISDSRIIPLIPTDVATLDPHSFDAFCRQLKPLEGRRVAFLFAGVAHRRGDHRRLAAVRNLFNSHFPGSWLIATGVLQATDVVAHGAGTAFVGITSSLRRPGLPGRSGGFGDARSFLPGTFDRSLLEQRSPKTYGLWYLATSPWRCPDCARPVTAFGHKPQIIEHNLHSIGRFQQQMCSQPVGDRPAWLDEQRRQALDRHAALSRGGGLVQADSLLRNLCELDDPRGRSTVPSDAWR